MSITSVTDAPAATAPPSVVRRWTPLRAGAVVLAVYVVLSLFNPSAAGYLSTDTGGKTATLEMMSRSGGVTPTVGYWAEEFDAEGRVHPFWFTDRVGDEWVNVTTLPMLYLAKPLYELGGYHLALLVPMLGGLAAAFAARSIARGLAGGDQWMTFWLAALASPLLVYSLDFWEHTLGAALTLWGFRAMLEVWTNPTSWLPALLAGAAFGGGATMRTESIVFGFAAVAVVCLWLLARRLLMSSVLVGALAGVGFVAVMALNSALENAVLGEVRRAGRATGTAAAGGGKIGIRIEEAFITGFGLFPTDDPTLIGVGVLLFGLLVAAVVLTLNRSERAPMVFVGVGALLLLRIVAGLGFVPGATMTVPIVAVAVAAGWRYLPLRMPLVIAAVAVPLVWAFQFTGGAIPQWGGRYLLPGSILLLAVGSVALQNIGNRVLTRGFVALSILLSLFGVGWTYERTNDFSEALHALAARSEEALVFRPAFIAREAGPLMLDEQWLTAGYDDDLPFAVDVLHRAGVERFGYVELAGEVDAVDAMEEARENSDAFGGFAPVEVSYIELSGGVYFQVTTFTRLG